MLDGLLGDDKDWLAFALHPVPTSADALAILDRLVRRIAHWLADQARGDSPRTTRAGFSLHAGFVNTATPARPRLAAEVGAQTPW
ncbi:MAG TPA: hypothetical protein VF469_13605 [Kofleriaceae bacterium]